MRLPTQYFFPFSVITLMKKYATIIIIALAAILAACTDDDTFSTSVGNTLTFSTDTVTAYAARASD